MANQIVPAYKPEEYNVLVPSQVIEQVSPWHAARTTVVQVNPDPVSGDVFKVGSRFNESTKAWEDVYCLAKPALMRIAAAAGIVWNWRESGPTAVQRDYVCYKAVGAVRLPDGSWQPIMAEKEIDLVVIEEETQESNLKKAYEYAGDAKKRSYLKGMEPEEWAAQQTRAAMIQWRKNKLMRAETGAMLRVVRAALGIKSQYSPAELRKPFVVPRVDFSPDYSDPQVRHALIQHGVAAMGALFGAATPPAPQVAFAERPALAAPPVEEAEAPVLDQAEPRPEELASEPAETAQAEASREEALEAPPQDDEAPPQDGTLFPSEPEPTPAPPPAASTKPRPVTYGTCADCGGKITSGSVVSYSQKKFGRVLCYSCQNKAKGAAANA